MSLSTRRATCMNADLRAPLNLPVCLLSLAFRPGRKGGTRVRPSRWPSSRRRRRSPSTVACRAVARSITRSPSWCTTPMAIRGAGMRLCRGSSRKRSAEPLSCSDLTDLGLSSARARLGGVRGEDLQRASHLCWLKSGPAEESYSPPRPLVRTPARHSATRRDTGTLAVSTTGGHSMGSATIKGNMGTPAALAAATTPLATAATKVASYQACIRLVHAYRYSTRRVGRTS